MSLFDHLNISHAFAIGEVDEIDDFAVELFAQHEVATIRVISTLSI